MQYKNWKRKRRRKEILAPVEVDVKTNLKYESKSMKKK